MTTPDPQAAKPPPGILAQPAGPKLKVKDGLEPAYANLARISHSPTEFVIDFGHMIPGEPTANINARVVMTPLSAKLLLRALNENLARYEAAFGEVKIPSGNTLADNLFRNLHPPEPPKE
ncbi:MAG: hypothetical protein CNIPEHKO_01964 [Anaerolineales bacterium]|nr:DUF3467 domain-containing protein [Anaerolineae bacterium]MBL8107263.1 DUF3467 domain-containing protein [Anaerolineales bacterium]MBV6401661.1 hypothetical protein [Anaerolineales bacterium]MCC7188422.1 DUF3467 domain-containing protein [Anaerolineales bacterium]